MRKAKKKNMTGAEFIAFLENLNNRLDDLIVQSLITIMHVDMILERK
ncbi:MAG: hypothetical protein WC640_00370 [Candidatus Paceibacterota bacterium]|jgi:hypothetical protein